jgi:hypothetical protein
MEIPAVSSAKKNEFAEPERTVTTPLSFTGYSNFASSRDSARTCLTVVRTGRFGLACAAGIKTADERKRQMVRIRADFRNDLIDFATYRLKGPQWQEDLQQARRPLAATQNSTPGLCSV